jgi:hypothetical protein
MGCYYVEVVEEGEDDSEDLFIDGYISFALPQLH